MKPVVWECDNKQYDIKCVWTTLTQIGGSRPGHTGDQSAVPMLHTHLLSQRVRTTWVSAEDYPFNLLAQHEQLDCTRSTKAWKHEMEYVLSRVSEVVPPSLEYIAPMEDHILACWLGGFGYEHYEPGVDCSICKRHITSKRANAAKHLAINMMRAYLRKGTHEVKLWHTMVDTHCVDSTNHEYWVNEIVPQCDCQKWHTVHDDEFYGFGVCFNAAVKFNILLKLTMQCLSNNEWTADVTNHIDLKTILNVLHTYARAMMDGYPSMSEYILSDNYLTCVQLTDGQFGDVYAIPPVGHKRLGYMEEYLDAWYIWTSTRYPPGDPSNVRVYLDMMEEKELLLNETGTVIVFEGNPRFARFRLKSIGLNH